MSQSNLDAIYGQIESLPSLPTVVTDVLRITEDPDSSANELMQAILPDQSMCATILKIANSAFFGLPREVSTLEKAVMVLGFEEVKNVVLGKAVFNSFQKLEACSKKHLGEFWTHSFNCGLAAKIIGEHAHLRPSELFVAGLLHDIGKLAMLLTFPNIYSHLLKSNSIEFLETCKKENELFFISHDKVAKRILNRWLFPEKLVNAVGHHHVPKEAGQHKLLASTVQIADMLVHIGSFEELSESMNYHRQLITMRADVFDIFDENNVTCTDEDIRTWLAKLEETTKRDAAVLTVFTS